MNPEIEKILNLFTEDFNTTYMYMTGRQRREIAYLAPTLFVRWYYSALFPETILSPSAIIESQPENSSDKKGFYSTCMHLKNINGDTLDFSFKTNYYSVVEHPIYRDLEILLNYTAPALCVNDDLSLKEKDIHALQKKLSVSDRYYALYLHLLARKLGMYSDVPSLYERCIQPDRSCPFMLLSPEEKLHTIVRVSCEICSELLNEEFPYDFCSISPDTIMEFVKNPIPIDDIFIKLYAETGIDLEEIWSKADKTELSEDDSAMLSSVFYMGILMDRAFIYVFGHYLRLIRPLYSFPMNFREIINSLFTAIAIDGERELEIFMPCTNYIHTKLGRLFFQKADKPQYPPIPIDKINHSVDEDRHLRRLRLNSGLMDMPKQNICHFKAVLNGNSALWKKIEMDDETPMGLVYSHLVMMFIMPAELKYKVVEGKHRYKSDVIPYCRLETLANPLSPLGSVIEKCGGKVRIVIENGTTLDLELEGYKAGCPEIIYPRISEQSKELTEKEHSLYSYD
ncbi:MAG: hypothetical protein PUD43_04115 [Clostridia bacterium]|nr:hypothetical protein [Clostridia bacterium]